MVAPVPAQILKVAPVYPPPHCVAAPGHYFAHRRLSPVFRPPLYFHTPLPRSARGTNPFPRKPFIFKSIQIPRGCEVSLRFFLPPVYPQRLLRRVTRHSPLCPCFHQLPPSFPSFFPLFCFLFLFFQSFAASFPKTPGVGLPLRELAPCTEAQKCPPVSPLPATLTHSVSRKSFPCHSYANTRDRGATHPPTSSSPHDTPHSPPPLTPFRIHTSKI